MYNRRIGIAAALAGLVGSLTAGAEHLTQLAVSNSNVNTFTQRYGNNPKSLNGSYRLNSNAAQQKRAARKLRNVRARASKRV